MKTRSRKMLRKGTEGARLFDKGTEGARLKQTRRNRGKGGMLRNVGNLILGLSEEVGKSIAKNEITKKAKKMEQGQENQENYNNQPFRPVDIENMKKQNKSPSPIVGTIPPTTNQTNKKPRTLYNRL